MVLNEDKKVDHKEGEEEQENSIHGVEERLPDFSNTLEQWNIAQFIVILHPILYVLYCSRLAVFPEEVKGEDGGEATEGGEADQPPGGGEESHCQTQPHSTPESGEFHLQRAYHAITHRWLTITIML